MSDQVIEIPQEVLEIIEGDTFFNLEKIEKFKEILLKKGAKFSLFEFLTYAINAEESLQNDDEVLLNILKFENLLNKYKFFFLVHLLLTKQANTSKLSFEDYKKLIGFNDKDIHIRLSNDPNINDDIALLLMDKVYLAKKGLLNNPSISGAIKSKIQI